MNADTAAFEDLAAKVAKLERQLRALAELQSIALGTGQPEPPYGGSRRRPVRGRRRERHLKAVE
jgi:hypothetical protein